MHYWVTSSACASSVSKLPLHCWRWLRHHHEKSHVTCTTLVLEPTCSVYERVLPHLQLQCAQQHPVPLDLVLRTGHHDRPVDHAHHLDVLHQAASVHSRAARRFLHKQTGTLDQVLQVHPCDEQVRPGYGTSISRCLEGSLSHKPDAAIVVPSPAAATHSSCGSPLHHRAALGRHRSLLQGPCSAMDGSPPSKSATLLSRQAAARQWRAPGR